MSLPSRFKKFKPSSLIGDGAYGEVFEVRDRVYSGRTVAVKRYRPEERYDGVRDDILRELSFTSELSPHPNILKLLDFFVEDKRTFVVFEHFGDSLWNVLKRNKFNVERHLKSCMRQLLEVVEHCHKNMIMHRDISSKNVLINKRGQLKLIDFGLATSVSPLKRPLEETIGAMWWRPPEIFLGAKYHGPAVDVWFIGTLMFEMSHGEVLFKGDSDIGTLFKIFMALGTPNEDVWSGVMHLPDMKADFPKWPRKPVHKWAPKLDEVGRDLLLALLTMDPSRRITAREALRHLWFETP